MIVIFFHICANVTCLLYFLCVTDANYAITNQAREFTGLCCFLSQTDEVLTTLECDTIDFGGNNASADFELEHESGTSKPNQSEQLLFVKVQGECR
jgi:hypothetical protein